MPQAERKDAMATINEKEVKSFPGMYGAGIISVAPVSSIVQQGIDPAETGLDEVVYTCLASETNPETGKMEARLVNLMDNGKFEYADTADVTAIRADLQPTLSFDRSLEDYGFKIGDAVRDPQYPNLGEWRVISDTEVICTDRALFGPISILGKSEDVLENAKQQIYRTYKEELRHAEQEYAFNKVKESLQSNDEIYIDEAEKESVLSDVTAGKDLAEAAEHAGASSSITENIMDTGIEFSGEFESHASKLLDLAKSISAKIKDLFVNDEIISTNDIMAKGADEETAHAIHDEAELRQESRSSLRKFGDACREYARELGRKSVYALAGICNKMSELKIDHYERLQEKEEKQITATMFRIKARAVREGNTLAAEQRVKAFVSNIGKSVKNIGIAISNTARFITSGNMAQAITTGKIDFDPTPYHPLIEGKDVRVTRSFRKTVAYRNDDNRIINSALHLGQIKAKLFNERIAAVPRAEREQTADMLIRHAAESIGRSSMLDRKIEYSTLEGFPSRSVPHVMEFTRNGLVIDGQNMRDIGYEGISRLVSPEAIMNLFVEAEKENLVALYERSELSAPEVVQDLNNEGIRMSYNIGNRFDRNENMVATKSDMHNELYEAGNMLHGGYSFADKLAEKKAEEQERRQAAGREDASVQVEVERVVPLSQEFLANGKELYHDLSGNNESNKEIWPAMVIKNAQALDLAEGDILETAGLSWTVIRGGMARCDEPIQNPDLLDAKDLVEKWAVEKGIIMPEQEKTPYESSLESFKKELEQASPTLLDAPDSVIETAYSLCHNYALDTASLAYDSNAAGGITVLSYDDSVIAAFHADNGECFKIYSETIENQLTEPVSHEDVSESLEAAI